LAALRGSLSRVLFRRLLSLLGWSSAFARPLRAQSSQSNVVGARWIDAGVVASSAGLGLLLDYATLRDRGLWRGRFTAQSNLGGGVSPEPSRSVTELSVMLGRGRVCCGNNWGSASLGLGMIFGTEDSAEQKDFTTIGVAGEVDLISWRRPHLSVRAFGNGNIERSFAGIALSLALGRMPMTP
jgi:hypothetical protein